MANRTPKGKHLRTLWLPGLANLEFRFRQMLGGRLPVLPANSVGQETHAHEMLPAGSCRSAGGTWVLGASGGSWPREPRLVAPFLVANMESLMAKDTYLQDLAKKICAQPGPERPRSKWGKASGPSSFWEWTPS